MRTIHVQPGGVRACLRAAGTTGRRAVAHLAEAAQQLGPRRRDLDGEAECWTSRAVPISGACGALGGRGAGKSVAPGASAGSPAPEAARVAAPLHGVAQDRRQDGAHPGPEVRASTAAASCKQTRTRRTHLRRFRITSPLHQARATWRWCAHAAQLGALWIGSIHGTSSGASTGSMSGRFTTTASLSERTSTHSSGSPGSALISWCGT